MTWYMRWRRARALSNLMLCCMLCGAPAASAVAQTPVPLVAPPEKVGRKQVAKKMATRFEELRAALERNNPLR